MSRTISKIISEMMGGHCVLILDSKKFGTLLGELLKRLRTAEEDCEELVHDSEMLTRVQAGLEATVQELRSSDKKLKMFQGYHKTQLKLIGELEAGLKLACCGKGMGHWVRQQTKRRTRVIRKLVAAQGLNKTLRRSSNELVKRLKTSAFDCLRLDSENVQLRDKVCRHASAVITLFAKIEDLQKELATRTPEGLKKKIGQIVEISGKDDG